MMLEKDWVHLNRADPEYEKGAWNFVKTVTRNLGNPERILCPCIDCRNVETLCGSTVVDHLVRRGMELKYKQRKDWYEHGEHISSDDENDEMVDNETYNLYRAAHFFDQDYMKLTEFGNEDYIELAKDIHDEDFISKLEDAETPLYPNCLNYNKLSATVALFQLKTQSGWTDKSFNELLETLPRMLPKDNVLQTSLYSVKKFLKTFEMGKFAYMGHRKFLSPAHSFREKRSWFDNNVEHGRKPRILTGRNISTALKSFPNDFGKGDKTKKRKRNENAIDDNDDSDNDGDASNTDDDLEELLRWKKRSIFFDLPYWEELPLQARLCGPVHFRWMYPFERYMKTLKDYVRNHARPEGCIAESYLAEECMRFCSQFLKKSIQVEEKEVRNNDFSNEVILEGRPISRSTLITLSDRDKRNAHLAVLMNTAMVDPYLDMHLEELQNSNIRLSRDATLLWNRHTEQFAEWIKMQIPIDSKNHSDTLKWIAYGPRNSALSFTGYIINGQRFHTKDVERETQNSGVTYEATSMCRASAKDTAQVADLVTYYGRLTDIILLDYHVFYIHVFRCHWAIKGNGVKVEDGFTFVNLHQSQVSFAKDPFILASQAKQVFYSREDDASNWYVVLKAPPRDFHELEEDDENADVASMTPEIDMDIDEFNDDVGYVREDCEGLLV
ncbi:hypothetical protein M0R45_008939 [Rubus argutus]|uniref:Transposase n=1 Tax=Rubus argutus TaxID=59490 RepID=A0AAW1Y339_RUBAR